MTDDLAARVWPTGNPKPRRRYVAIRVVREQGGYSSYCPSLAGVHGQGDGPIEALHDAMKALQAAIESYDELGLRVPWRDASPSSPGEIDLLVEVFDGYH